MFFERQSKCSNVAPAAGPFTESQKTFSLAGGKASVCKKSIKIELNVIPGKN